MLSLAGPAIQWRTCPRCAREQVGHRVLASLKHYLHRAKASLRSQCKIDTGHQLVAVFSLVLCAFGALGICIEGRADRAMMFALPMGPVAAVLKWVRT